MSLRLIYLLLGRLLAFVALVLCTSAKDAELLVLRHEIAVLQRQVTQLRYQPANRLWSGRAEPVASTKTLGRSVRRDTGDAAALAPPAGLQTIDLHRRAGTGTATHAPSSSAADFADGRRKSDLGTPTGSGRAGRPRIPDRPFDGLGDPYQSWARSGAEAVGTELARILDRAGDAADRFEFLHVDTVLLRRIYVLIFIEHGTRRLHVAGATTHPTGHWVAQQARTLAMDMQERFESPTFLIRDRDSEFTAAFDAVFGAEGIRVIKSPPQAPKANAIRERMVGKLRREFLDRMLIINTRQLINLLAV